MTRRRRACAGFVAAALVPVPAGLADLGPAIPVAPAGLRVDVTGDGLVDTVRVRRDELLIESATGTLAERAPGRLDGAVRIRGRSGALLLLRAATGRNGFLDGVYRIQRGRLERLHVDGPYGDGVVTALSSRSYLDVDCGRAPRTLVQIELEPRPRGWRVTTLTFVLDGRHFTLTDASRRPAEAAGVPRRRCAVVRR